MKSALAAPAISLAIIGASVSASVSAAGCGSRTALATPTTTSDGIVAPSNVPIACSGVPPLPTLLVDLDPNDLVYSLALDGDDLFYSAIHGDSVGIYRVSLHGGAPELFYRNDVYYGMPLAVDGAYVYFAVLGNVLYAQPLGGGAPVSFDHPIPYPQSLVTNGSPGVFFQDDSPYNVSHWNPATGASAIVAELDLEDAFLVDRDHVYFLAGLEATRELRSVPIAGGAQTTIAPFPVSAADEGRFVLFGFDATHLVYRSNWPGTISRIDKTGGNNAVIVDTGAVGGLTGGTWLYEIYQAGDSTSLHRRPITGGAVEAVWRTDNRSLQAITTDACHVVWTASNERQIFVVAN